MKNRNVYNERRAKPSNAVLAWVASVQCYRICSLLGRSVQDLEDKGYTAAINLLLVEWY